MADLPKRKHLRLSGYDYSRSNAYFITICTQDRRRLFGEIVTPSVGAHPCVRPSAAGKMIEKWLITAVEKFPEYIIDTYVIMPDHIHFVIIKCVPLGGHMGPPLQAVIQWFKTQTTNEYIRGVKSQIYPPFDKKLWQRSYYDHIIRNAQDMQEIRKYIYENPLRWFAENKEDFPWN